MQEGISYMVGAELPCVIVNVMRGGPGLGTIQPSQADYFQTVKGGGHGDYKLITLAPASVQEMADFMVKSFDLAFKYRTPVMILADGIIGQMMEKVELFDQVPRLTDAEIKEKYPWATTGKSKGTERRIITSLDLDSHKMERHNQHLQEKYKLISENEIRFEALHCEDAEYVFVAYGSSARIAQKAVEMARKKGIKAGLFRLITLFPFPTKELQKLCKTGVKGFLAVELSAGQMVEDVQLAVRGCAKVDHFGRFGGVIHTPEEVEKAMEQKIIGG